MLSYEQASFITNFETYSKTMW